MTAPNPSPTPVTPIASAVRGRPLPAAPVVPPPPDPGAPAPAAAPVNPLRRVTWRAIGVAAAGVVLMALVVVCFMRATRKGQELWPYTVGSLVAGAFLALAVGGMALLFRQEGQRVMGVTLTRHVKGAVGVGLFALGLAGTGLGIWISRTGGSSWGQVVLGLLTAAGVVIYTAAIIALARWAYGLDRPAPAAPAAAT